jgi:hypothetical protein
MTSVLELIGETPLIEVTRFDRGPCRLFLKLESANPSGSIKDRPARAMIEAAESDGTLKPGGAIVEATAGNTGLGLALVGVRKGHRIVRVVPDKVAREKISPGAPSLRDIPCHCIHTAIGRSNVKAPKVGGMDTVSRCADTNRGIGRASDHVQGHSLAVYPVVALEATLRRSRCSNHFCDRIKLRCAYFHMRAACGMECR